MDVNKGDEICPNYRSRLVARQLKAKDPSTESFFAPTPPLEALRLVLSLTATTIGDHRPDWRPESPDRTQISCVDIARAYFNAKCDPADPTYVQLPEEDGDTLEWCGLLLRHMYGTRRAAEGWQEEYSTFLVHTLGFAQGSACPNLFKHHAKGIVCSVHGDDFTSSGPKSSLDWLEESIKEKYEATIQPRLGPGRDDAKEVRVLNRVIRWCPQHIEYEADPRQTEKLLLDCGLEGCNSVATPGVRVPFQDLESDPELPENLHSAFRGAAARGNYLSADRLDCMFACKEICRSMARPTQSSWDALKRMCRYLAGLPRLIYKFSLQEVKQLDTYVDTDWAGCPKTRRSTSGGCILLGSHAVKHWSSTQASVTLSSGEAEFHGVVKGCGMALGCQSLLKDLGVEIPVRVWTDSSAALGICGRQGLGKLRHLDTHLLWVQQAVRQKRVELRKVPGTANPADLFTKHSLSRERLTNLVSLFDCYFAGGRAASAPELRRELGSKTTMAQAEQHIHQTILLTQEAGEELPVVMPHIKHNPRDLDRHYPPIRADDNDATNGDDYMEPTTDEPLLSEGERIAQCIRDETNVYGRTVRAVIGTAQVNHENEPQYDAEREFRDNGSGNVVSPRARASETKG